MVRADPSLLGESRISINLQPCVTAFFISRLLTGSLFHSQVFLWTRHLRDWIWARLRLWRTFKGLQPSKPPLTVSDMNSSCFTWTPAAVPPRLLPQLSPIFSVSRLSDMNLVIPHKFFKKTVNSEAGCVPCCLRTYNLTKPLQRNGLEGTGQWKQPTNQDSNLQINSKFWRGVDLLGDQLLESHVLSLANFKFGIHCMGCFFFFKCGYTDGVVGVSWERLERLYPLFLFYLLKFSPSHFNPPPVSFPSLFSAGCSWMTTAE